MGQAKLRKKLGIYPAQAQDKTFTVGIVATNWSASPRYSMATAMLTVVPDEPALQKSIASLQAQFTIGELVNGMQEFFEKNMMLTHQSLFGAVVMAYVTQTQTYNLGRMQGATGMWLKLLSRKDEGKKPVVKARPFGAFSSEGVMDLMNRVRKRTITAEECSMFVHSDHPDDEDIVGDAAHIEGEIVDLSGQTFMASSWGTGKTTYSMSELMQKILRAVR